MSIPTFDPPTQPLDHNHVRLPGLQELPSGLIVPANFAPSVYGTGTTAIDPDDATSHGVSTSLSRTDHQHSATAGTPNALTKTATSAENNGTSFARNNHTHATSALPWGIVARQTLAGNSAAYTTGLSTTDFALASVTVDVTRLYKVCLGDATYTLSGTGTLRWDVRFYVGGVYTDRFGIVYSNVIATDDINAFLLWEPASGTVNVDVRLNNVSGTTPSLTFNADADARRRFWIEDIGPR